MKKQNCNCKKFKTTFKRNGIRLKVTCRNCGKVRELDFGIAMPNNTVLVRAKNSA